MSKHPGRKRRPKKNIIKFPRKSVQHLLESGTLDKIFDLTETDNLKPFVELIKNFKLSNALKATAKKLYQVNPNIIKTPHELSQNLLRADWRQWPVSCDIPANSQIFGHLICSAGIEGILYTSKFTGKLCLAVFPRNFVGTDSYITLDDEPPHASVPTRIDAYNWRVSEQDIKEILG